MTFPTFSTGEVLTATDMNAVGMWLVKTQTITGTPSTVAVTGAFSADYDAYKVVVSNGSMSVSNSSLSLVIGAAASGYDNGGIFFGSASTGGLGGLNQGSIPFIGEGTTNYIQCNFEVQNPFLAKHTTYQGLPAFNTANVNSRLMAGVLQNTTSYTAFSLIAGAGTFTSGTIRVYGMRN
jgi:hypothetical protein